MGLDKSCADQVPASIVSDRVGAERTLDCDDPTVLDADIDRLIVGSMAEAGIADDEINETASLVRACCRSGCGARASLQFAPRRQWTVRRPAITVL